jgi:hypothetical protein
MKNIINFKNFKINDSIKKNTINSFEINDIYSCLIYCINKNTQCIITDGSLNNVDNDSNIVIIKNKKKIFITWEEFHFYNKFFYKKYKNIKIKYKITNSIFIIFFLKFIDKNYKFIDNKSKIKLIGYQSSLFGIYNTYQENIVDCHHNLYFSYNLNKFILYRVLNKDKYVIGKLVTNLKYKNNNLIVNNRAFNCPNSFVNVNKNIFGIKKKEIEIIVKNKKIIKCSGMLQSYIDFCIQSENKNIYKLLLYTKLNRNYFYKLYEFIIKSYPNLFNKSNMVMYLPNKIPDLNTHFSMYFQEINSRDFIIIEINQCIIQYLPYIFKKINFFIDSIYTKNVLFTDQSVIQKINKNKHIHLISEIYFFISFIILFLPRTIINLKKNDDDYIQANYKFSKEETNKLFENKSNFFEDNILYLKSIIIKTLGVFLNNYYCFIHEENNIDIVPISTNTSNSHILNLLNRSSKAICSKIFLISLISNLFKNLKNKSIEIPVVFININNIGNQNIQIDKIYSKSKKKNIPIFINILYSDELHISLSYKKSYKKIKYIFNEIIEELI